MLLIGRNISKKLIKENDSSKKNSNYIRIIGGFNNIANTVNFTPNRFLFNLKSDCDETTITGPLYITDKYCTYECYDQNITLTKLSNFVYGSNIIDYRLYIM